MTNSIYTKIKNFLPKDNVLLSKEECYCYSTDACNIKNDKVTPKAVVFVETIEDVQKIVKYASKYKIPIISRGAGTNMVGACVCEKPGIIINFSKMKKIININPTNMTATVEPGVVIGDLKNEVEKFNLFFPPDPSSYKVATIGGAISQSSGGALSLKYGTIKDYVISLKVVMADGSVITLGTQTTKNAAGYHLAQLMVGSEGTLGLIVEATVKLIAQPETKCVVSAYFDDIGKLTSATEKIITNNIMPAAIDFMDTNSIKTVEEYSKCGLDTSYKAMILIELDGLTASMPEQVNIVKNILEKYNVEKINISKNTEEYNKIWDARRVSYAAATRLAPDVISDDIIVPRQSLSEMIELIQNIYSKYKLNLCLIGHIADGNLHPQVSLNLDDDTDFKNYQLAKSEIYKNVVKFGGAISAEHGIGLAKRSFIEQILDSKTLEYMRLIKKSFDPDNILNPDKIFRL